MDPKIELKQNVLDFFTAKNVTIGIVSLVLIVALAIALQSDVTSKIIILLVIGGIVVYPLYLIPKLYSSKEPAYDYIPAKDREMIEKLIAENDKERLEIFKQVISLYGFTGNITRLGLSGLPLLTVILTLIFSFLAALTWFVGLYLNMKNPAVQDISAAVMDLAKLTLGAFIGSFVQRNVSERVSEKPSPQTGGVH